MGRKVWSSGDEVLAADFMPHVVDQVVTRFANAGARSSAWPSPGVGACSVLDDGPGRLWLYTGTQWVRADWYSAWGTLDYKETSAGQTGLGGITDVTGLSSTLTYTGLRRVRIASQIFLAATGGGGEGYTVLREGAAQLQETHRSFTGTGIRDTLNLEWVGVPTAGSHTYKMSAGKNAFNVDVVGSAMAPNFMVIQDIGPVGPPTALLRPAPDVDEPEPKDGTP